MVHFIFSWHFHRIFWYIHMIQAHKVEIDENEIVIKMLNNFIFVFCFYTYIFFLTFRLKLHIKMYWIYIFFAHTFHTYTDIPGIELSSLLLKLRKNLCFITHAHQNQIFWNGCLKILRKFYFLFWVVVLINIKNHSIAINFSLFFLVWLTLNLMQFNRLQCFDVLFEKQRILKNIRMICRWENIF